MQICCGKQNILAGVHGGQSCLDQNQVMAQYMRCGVMKTRYIGRGCMGGSYIEGDVMLFGQLTIQLQVQDRLSADTLSTLIPSLLLSNTGILYVNALSTSYLGKWLKGRHPQKKFF